MLKRSLSLVAIVMFAGCGTSESIDENVVLKTHQLIENLESEVTSGDFLQSAQTIEKIESDGVVNAQELSGFLALKARSEIGRDQFESATATISELERGADEMAIVHLLKGELALKQGDRARARSEFTQARRYDPSISTPRI